MKIEDNRKSAPELTRMDEVEPGQVYRYYDDGEMGDLHLRTNSTDYCPRGSTGVCLATGTLGWDHPDTEVHVLQNVKVVLS